MAQSFLEQEREARAYNKAFLHGKEYGLSTGRNVAIDQVLEIIDKAQTYKMAVGSTDLFIDRESFREDVLALKGGEKE